MNQKPLNEASHPEISTQNKAVFVSNNSQLKSAVSSSMNPLAALSSAIKNKGKPNKE
jgi:hypothetical protein